MKTNKMFGYFVIFSTSFVVLIVDGPRLAWGQVGASDALDPPTQALTNEVRAQTDQMQAQAEQMRAQLEHPRANYTRRSQAKERKPKQ